MTRHPPKPPDEESWPPAKGVGTHETAPAQPIADEGIEEIPPGPEPEPEPVPPPGTTTLSGPHHS